MSSYPEHEKLAEKRKEHKIIQDFCRFLSGNGLLYRREAFEDEYGDPQVTYWSLKDNEIATIISEYFDIDMDKFEKEKHQMLAALKKYNENNRKD